MDAVSQPRLLVIGGTGFIGHHLVRHCVEIGWSVTSISLHRPALSREVDGANYIETDVSCLGEVSRVILGKSFEYVVNLGDYIDHSLFHSGGKRQIATHFETVKNFAEILNRDVLKRFIQIGSSDEYGRNPSPQHEEQRENAISPYALGKVAATHFLQMLWRTEGFPSTTLRLFLTYGPGQDEGRFLPQIIRGCLEDREIPVSDGGQVRDFCYIDDTVEAIHLALESKLADGMVLNLASGKPSTIRELINLVHAQIGRGHPIYGRIPYRPGENMSLVADVTKIRELLRWEPTTPIERGIRETIEWMKMNRC